jgi:DUF4097 and DUF4098 domain-containing protein YvlB
MVSIEDTISRTFETGERPEIVIETFNGSVHVRANPGASVLATVTRHGSGLSEDAARRALEHVEVTIRQDGNTIYVLAQQHESLFRRARCGANVSLTAPPNATISVRTSNGHITGQGFAGGLTVRTSNGSVNLRDAAAPIEARSSNGGIRIELAGVTDGSVRADTSNGPIELTGELGAGAHWLSTSNGSIKVRLPGDASFALEASTSNGRVHSQFPFSSGGWLTQQVVRANVGSNPSAHVRLGTSNGGIHIEALEVVAERPQPVTFI